MALATDRKNLAIEEMLFGENAAINLNHGPAHMLKNSEDFKVNSTFIRPQTKPHIFYKFMLSLL